VSFEERARVSLVPDNSHEPAPLDTHVANVSLPARLYGSKHTHRLIPARLALALAAVVGPAARQRMNSSERRDGERFMTDLLLHTPHAPEAEDVARRWLVEKSRVGELLWRPWLLKHSRLLGREHWDAAHRPGRGRVIVMVHFGPDWATSAILCRNGLDHYVIGHAHYWAPTPGYAGLMKRHRGREYFEKPCGAERALPSDGAPERLLELLRAGENILIAFDVPGSAATPFLGRSVALAGGVATLPFKANAMVIPAVPERHGTRSHLRLLPPIDPGDHRDPRSLRAAIAQTFEPVVLARPEAVGLTFVPSPLVTEAPPSGVTVAGRS
jgi:lauroyl/myristoyl acyltransferase